MRYKLIAVDIDGTLLDDKGQLSRKTEQTIKEVVERGVIFTLSTGRPISGIGKYVHLVSSGAPVIVYNGAKIVNPITGNAYYKKELTDEAALKILERGNALGTTVAAWCNDRLYFSVLNEKAEAYKVKREAVMLSDMENLAREGIIKILWIDSAERIGAFSRELKIEPIEKTSAFPSEEIYMEFVDSSVSKGAALKKVGEICGIKQNEIIAIGNGFNDVSMIKNAGLGVAMENAPDEVKSYADYITCSNDCNGVAAVLEKFVLDEGYRL